MESARRSRARLPPVISLTLVLSLCVGATSFELTQGVCTCRLSCAEGSCSDDRYAPRGERPRSCSPVGSCALARLPQRTAPLSTGPRLLPTAMTPPCRGSNCCGTQQQSRVLRSRWWPGASHIRCERQQQATGPTGLRRSPQAHIPTSGQLSTLSPPHGLHTFTCAAWYFSLKTSKGYCGLVPLSTTAGGYGFAISCANKLPVYDSQFTLLSADAPSSPGGAAWAGADAAAVEAAAGPAAGQRGHHGYMTDEAHRVRLLLAGGADPRAHLQDGELGSAAGAATIAREAGAAAAGAAPVHDPNAPVVVTSGTPLRLLSRSAGLCGSVPPPGRASSQQQRPQQQQQQQGAASQAGNTGSQARGGPAPAGGFAACSRLLPAAWWAWLHCRALPALQAALHAVSRALQLPQTFPLLPAPGACRDAAAAAPAGATGAGADAGGSGPGGPPLLGDTAPWPVTCVLAQPGSLQWRLFKSDLKDNATVDLAVDWLYLMEGDKYCTLAGERRNWSEGWGREGSRRRWRSRIIGMAPKTCGTCTKAEWHCTAWAILCIW